MTITSPALLRFASRRALAAIAATLTIAGALASPAKAETLLSQGFEDIREDALKVFIPQESQEMNCKYAIVRKSPHSGASCLRMEAEDFARFAVTPKGAFAVQGGKRYRVSVWARLDDGSEAKPGHPGFLVRVAFNGTDGKMMEEHRLHILPGDSVSLNSVVETPITYLTLGWRKIQAVIEAPAGATSATTALFMWRLRGVIYLDDLLVEEVDSSQRVTPVIGH